MERVKVTCEQMKAIEKWTQTVSHMWELWNMTVDVANSENFPPEVEEAMKNVVGEKAEQVDRMKDEIFEVVTDDK